MNDDLNILITFISGAGHGAYHEFGVRSYGLYAATDKARKLIAEKDEKDE